MRKTITYPTVGGVTLSRTRRSTRIALTVRSDGSVRLSFPPWVTQRRALKFLDEKLDWIAAARLKMARKYPELAQPPGGASGGSDTTDTGGSGTTPGARGSFPENQTPKADKPAQNQARKRALEALRAEAKQKLPQLTARLAQEHGFRHGAIKVKATKSRWGSCTAKNDINLSLSLLALPPHLAEYIVLHELCHTVHHNHSARFHALLDRVSGGRSRALDRALKSYRPDALLAAALQKQPPYLII